MNDHPPERVDPLLCVERELPLADLSSGFMRRKAMISYENTKTVRDLVWNTGREYAGRVFLRYEENDVVYEVTYDEFATQCRGVAAWLREQDAAAGHKVRVGLMGSSSHHYLVFLLGVMASGNVVVPLDVQLNEETFADNVNRSDLDILFYDWDHYKGEMSTPSGLHFLTARKTCAMFGPDLKGICRDQCRSGGF